MMADLGPHASCHTQRLRSLTTDRDVWTRVEAAYALWAVTGESDTTAPVLTAALRELAEGAYRPVMLPAVRHLARTGRSGEPDIPDEAIRAAVEELLAASGGAAAAPA
jgi:1,2-phenylacetyl-CoA epoxidase PaaB subunit